MNSREKLLVLLVVVGVVVFGMYFIVSGMYLSPAAVLDAQIAERREKLRKAREEVARETALKAKLRELAAQTFDTDPARAAEAARARLTFLLHASGFNQQGLSLNPSDNNNATGQFRDVGWSVRAKGPINAVVNFLYLVQRDPRVARLENVTLTPVSKSDQVSMQLRYGTLVLLPDKPGAKAPAADLVPAPLPAAVLDDPHRQAFQLIVERNLFRPYVAKGSVWVASSTTSDGQPAPIPVEAAQYRVVGLPEANGKPLIMVQDSVTHTTMTYKPGDSIVNTVIVAVDYRPMPRPDKPLLTSDSRVIVRAESAYWAVDLGRTFSERYKLTPEQLPSSLPRMPDVSPVSETPTPAAPASTGG